MIGLFNCNYEDLNFYSDFNFNFDVESEIEIEIVKATAFTDRKDVLPATNSSFKADMDRLFTAAKNKLTGSHSKDLKNHTNASKERLESLKYSSSTLTKRTCGSSILLNNEDVGRPESDAEIFALYAEAMLKLGVDVESVPALKNKSPEDMWSIIRTADLQTKDDKYTPEYFANKINEESTSSHDFNMLKSLRIALGSKPLSWNDDFARFGGWDGVVDKMKKILEVKQLESKLPPLRELLKIFRAFTNNKMGLEYVFAEASRAGLAISALINVFNVPCKQCRLAAVELLLMSALIEESRLVPVIVEEFSKVKFSNFTTILTEAFNTTRSKKDFESYGFIVRRSFN